MQEPKSITIDDWNVILDEYYPRAKHKTTTVDVADGVLSIDASVGSGYDVIDVHTSIPLDVIITLLKNAGFNIQK